MSELANQACQPCHEGAEKLTGDALAEAALKVPKWQVIERNGEKQLLREFSFKNFAEALAFTNKVGEIAEQEDHHPEILTGYGKAAVTWWTHKIGGLHHNDFIMAARTDGLYPD